MWVKSRRTLKVEDQKIGIWLHAATLSMSRRTVIRVARMDEEDKGDEDGQQNDREGVNEGIGSGKRMDIATEDARVARHREDDSDMSDKINEGAHVTEIPLISNSIKDDYSIMDVIPNSLAHSNSNTNNQRADFLKQLVDIDNELLKFDNIQVRGEISYDSVSKGDSGLQRESMVIRPKALGLHFNYDVAKEKGMTPKRGLGP